MRRPTARRLAPAVVALALLAPLGCRPGPILKVIGGAAPRAAAPTVARAAHLEGALARGLKPAVGGVARAEAAALTALETRGLARGLHLHLEQDAARLVPAEAAEKFLQNGNKVPATLSLYEAERVSGSFIAKAGQTAEPLALLRQVNSYGARFAEAGLNPLVSGRLSKGMQLARGRLECRVASEACERAAASLAKGNVAEAGAVARAAAESLGRPAPAVLRETEQLGRTSAAVENLGRALKAPPAERAAAWRAVPVKELPPGLQPAAREAQARVLLEPLLSGRWAVVPDPQLLAELIAGLPEALQPGALIELAAKALAEGQPAVARALLGFPGKHTAAHQAFRDLKAMLGHKGEALVPPAGRATPAHELALPVPVGEAGTAGGRSTVREAATAGLPPLEDGAKVETLTRQMTERLPGAQEQVKESARGLADRLRVDQYVHGRIAQTLTNRDDDSPSRTLLPGARQAFGRELTAAERALVMRRYLEELRIRTVELKQGAPATAAQRAAVLREMAQLFSRGAKQAEPERK